jgi:hypothetical protein
MYKRMKSQMVYSVHFICQYINLKYIFHMIKIDVLESCMLKGMPNSIINYRQYFINNKDYGV